MPLFGAGKTPVATSAREGGRATKAQKLAQQAAADLNLLTDADREQLRLEQPGPDRNIVADRLLSPNGLISALMLAGTAWVVRHPQTARRGWQSLQQWSLRVSPRRSGAADTQAQGD